MLNAIEEACKWLQQKIDVNPKTAIILGSGLGEIVNSIDIVNIFDYKLIPNFPVSTVEGHKGRLIFGKLNDVDVLAMDGRFHYYEGYSMKEVTFPIRVMKELGIENIFVSNAAGGINPNFQIGDIMIIKDHINMLPENPLRGQNISQGPRFLDMSQPYYLDFITKAKEVAQENNINIHEGVYLATQGPTYETISEYKMFRFLGADAVGMSTVPEVIVANHCGIKVFGVSVITNIGQNGAKVSHEEVKKIADDVQPKLTKIFCGLIQKTM